MESFAGRQLTPFARGQSKENPEVACYGSLAHKSHAEPACEAVLCCVHVLCRFFRQAKDADYLKRTLLAGLPPLPQRCMEIRMVRLKFWCAGVAALLVVMLLVMSVGRWRMQGIFPWTAKKCVSAELESQSKQHSRAYLIHFCPSQRKPAHINALYALCRHVRDTRMGQLRSMVRHGNSMSDS